MNLIATTARGKLIDRLTAPQGIGASLAALTEPGLSPAPLRLQNAAPDLADRSTAVQYPALSVYCEKITNDQREKFASFSGRVQMAIEVRHSQDHLEGIEGTLEQYTDVVTKTLTANRGDWGDGMYYNGAFEVSFGAVKRGGKNFTQAAKVSFEVGVSRS
jgi:hypothetical protein